MRGEGGGGVGGACARVLGGKGVGALGRQASPCGRPLRVRGQGWPKSAGEPGALLVTGGLRTAMGPAPRSAGTNPAEHHPRGRILVEAGGVPHRPLASEPDRDGPRRRDTGGAGWAGHRGSEARVPVVRGPARGRPGGP